MVTALAGLCAVALARQDAAPGQTVQIGGREVAFAWPDEPAPFTDQSAGYVVGDWKYAVQGGNLLRAYRKTGGWDEAAAEWEANKPKAGATVSPVKIFVLTRATVLERNRDGVWRGRRGGLEPSQVRTILQGALVFERLAEASALGQVDVKLDVTIDPDPVFVLADGRNPLFGRSFIESELAARVNDDPFESISGPSQGPFTNVVVIHAGLTGESWWGKMGRTPATTVPYSSFTAGNAGWAVPNRLFAAWSTAIVQRATGSEAEGTVPPEMDWPLRPVPGTDWAALAAAAAAPKFGPPSSPLINESVAASDPRAVVPLGAGRLAVRLDALEFALKNLTGSRVVGLALHEGAARWVVTSAATGGSDAEVLGLEASPTPAAAALPQAIGELAVTQEDDGGPAWKVTRTGFVPRGKVVLARGADAARLAANGFSTAYKATGPEPFALVFARAGRPLLAVSLAGEAPIPEDPAATDVPVVVRATGQTGVWVPVSAGAADLAAAAQADEVWVGAPPFGWSYERPTLGEAHFWLRPLGPFDPAIQPGPAPGSVYAALAGVSGDVSEAQASTVTAFLNAPDARMQLNGAMALNQAKMPSAVPDLARLANATVLSTAYSALRALAHQDTPEAWAAIKRAVEGGAFDHSRRFAAQILAERPDASMAAALNFMTTRSWHARWEAARALGKITDPNAQVILSTMLLGEPEPTVRLEIARSGDVSVDLLARRLLFAAVNDDSQAVRLTALTRLLGSPLAQIREEALKGVRDEAVGVRLGLLAAIQARASDEDRAALRLAVTDAVPAVRAAALDAFAAQPGKVAIEEVQNVLRDADAGVQAALRRLAQAKGLTLP